MKSSRIERLILHKLERYFKVKIQRQFKLEGKYFDGKFKNVLIELDGIYWHRTKKQLTNDTYKNHLAEKHGYKIYRFKVINKDVNALIGSNIKTLNEIFKK